MSEKVGYIPLFGSLIHSTVWREPNHVRILWITMLCMADADGYVGASLPGLADAARISREQCREALSILMAPDPDSRDPVDGGQRVFQSDRGWTIPAVKRFRERVGSNAKRCRDYRKRKKAKQKDRCESTGRDGSQAKPQNWPTPPSDGKPQPERTPEEIAAFAERLRSGRNR